MLRARQARQIGQGQPGYGLTYRNGVAWQLTHI